MQDFFKYEFYAVALVNAPYSQGVLYLARQIQRDKDLSEDARVHLIIFAANQYLSLSGRDLYFDL